VRFRVHCLLLAGGLAAAGAEPGLVRVGEVWSYWSQADESMAASPGWRFASYNDLRWLRGISGFGYASYETATLLPEMGSADAGCALFRKVFAVADPGAIRWLVLRADYQGGFVAWINGVEVARRGVAGAPGEPVPADEIGASRAAGAAEEFDISEYRGALVPGDNVLAVQAHRSSGYSFALVPELLANITRGPAIRQSPIGRVRIEWRTPVPTDTRVEWGGTEALGRAILRDEKATEHAVDLDGLEPGSRGFYRVGGSDGLDTAWSPVLPFRAWPSSGPVRFLVLGDSGSGQLPQHQIARVMESLEPDLVIHTGDIIYPYLTAGRVDLKCLSVHASAMATLPFFFALGNHDRYASLTDFFAAFHQPDNGVSNANFFSFDCGEAHFAVLDTDMVLGPGIEEGSAQLQWLEADLARASRPWKILVFHNVIRSSGPHRGDDYNRNGVADWIDIQSTVGEVAARHGVQMIFTGHDHCYERMGPVDGVHVIVSGGGGGTLYARAGFADPTLAQYHRRYHCVEVSVDRERLDLRAVDNAGEVFDAMTLQRIPPRSEIRSAAWHRPDIETDPMDPAAVNQAGQTFDFRGDFIPVTCGLFSNLGRCYVASDESNLYVGLAHVMIGPDDAIVLAVGTAADPSPSGLERSQAIDGSCLPPGLPPLGCRGFEPRVVCLLGDERADGARSPAVRALGSAALAQGIFQVAAGFPECPGSRLQQFNRSPQDAEAAGEQNADFIEIAIPLGALGGPLAGEEIALSLAAVRWSSTNGGWQYTVDAGRLGSRDYAAGLDASCQSPPEEFARFGPQAQPGPHPALEPVWVRLARNPDLDGDGLDDGWEREMGLDPARSTGEDGAAGDPDSDGHSNRAEMLAGTHPRHWESALRLSAETLPGRRLRLTWPAVPGRRYRVESRGVEANAVWQTLGLPVTAYRSQASLSCDQPASAARVYRLRLDGSEGGAHGAAALPFSFRPAR